jgi:hypothetical protein
MVEVADDMTAGYKIPVNESETITVAQPNNGLPVGGYPAVSHPIDRS